MTRAYTDVEYATADELPPGFIPKAVVLKRGWTTKIIYAVLNPIGVRVPPSGPKKHETSPWWYPVAEVERLEASDPAVRHAVAVTRACVKLEPTRYGCGHGALWDCRQPAVEAGTAILLRRKAEATLWAAFGISDNAVRTYINCADFSAHGGHGDAAKAAQRLRAILPRVYLHQRLQRDHEFAAEFVAAGAHDWPVEWLEPYAGLDLG